jgi:multisubunit Na+/H+ antiporter MnhF subunit
METGRLGWVGAKLWSLGPRLRELYAAGYGGILVTLELKLLWQITRRPVLRKALRIVSLVVLVVAVAGSTFVVALFLDEKTWAWLKVLLLPAVIAFVGTVGGAWFTRERARDAILQAYLDKMSELLIDRKIHEEYGRYAVTRVTARARILAVLSQLDGKRKRTVLLFLREARLINRKWHVREGQRIYPCIIRLRNADLSDAHLRGLQLISTDQKKPASLEGVILRGADLRYADLEHADLRGADLRSADLRGACLKGVDLDDSGESNRPADLRGANLQETEGLDEELLRKAIGDRTTKLPSALRSFNAWHDPVDEYSCREKSVPQPPRT